MKSITFTFGRFQPPHWDHTQLILACCEVANSVKNNNLKIYTGMSNDKKKNPLSFEQKVSFMEKLCPYVDISKDPKLRTIFDVINGLLEEEYEDFHLVVGEDRYKEFVDRILPNVFKLPKYNIQNCYFQIHPTKHQINIHSTTLRDLIRNKQFDTFADMYKQNTTLSDENIRLLINQMASKMGLELTMEYNRRF